LNDPQIIALLEQHVTRARAETAPGSAHALDPADLRSPEVSFFSAWDGGRLLGVGALKQLSPTHGEIKSMHTTASRRRNGVGTALLQQIITEARNRGLTRLSLETGSWDYFEATRMFYRRNGFLECTPFGAYKADANSVFMTLELRD
jgi:putative acetyltransferase